jgi:hypothetical protein
MRRDAFGMNGATDPVFAAARPDRPVRCWLPPPRALLGRWVVVAPDAQVQVHPAGPQFDVVELALQVPLAPRLDGEDLHAAGDPPQRVEQLSYRRHAGSLAASRRRGRVGRAAQQAPAAGL